METDRKIVLPAGCRAAGSSDAEVQVCPAVHLDLQPPNLPSYDKRSKRLAARARCEISVDEKATTQKMNPWQRCNYPAEDLLVEGLPRCG